MSKNTDNKSIDKIYDKVILGGGWAGLLYANKEKSNNKKIVIIEMSNENELGGLLKSEVIDGFTFDVGGPHLLFSRNQDYLSFIVLLLGENVSKRSRNNYVFYNNQLIPYPFENGIYKLRPEKRVKFITNIIEKMIYLAKNKDYRPNNFLEWIINFFGETMANEYLIPYNEKIWKRDLDKISADWVFMPGRLPFPDVKKLIESAAGIPNVGYEEQAFFYYPKEGGIQSLYNSIFNLVNNKGVNFIFGEKVNNIELINNIYLINNNIKAKKVVNTIPLPEILIALDEDKKLADQFDYNSVVIVGIALNKPTPNQTTVYIPDKKIIFHRYTWMSSLIPPKEKEKSNIIAEITIPKNQEFYLNQIEKEVINGLLKLNIIDDEKEIIFTKSWFNKYGYPIYTLNHNEIRGRAMEILNNHGIKSVGRWGSWHYWNTDMVYKAVYEID
jgi:protoporphyrinogen oxidase